MARPDPTKRPATSPHRGRSRPDIHLHLSLRIDADGLPVPARPARGGGEGEFLSDIALGALRAAIDGSGRRPGPEDLLDIDLEISGTAKEGDLGDAIELFVGERWADLIAGGTTKPFSNGIIKLKTIYYKKSTKTDDVGGEQGSGGQVASGENVNLEEKAPGDPGPVGIEPGESTTPSPGPSPTPAEALRKLVAGLPGGYRELADTLLALNGSFRRELSSLLATALGPYLRSAPQSNLDEKKALVKWLSDELGRFGLSVAHPISGVPCRVVALDADTEDGRFQLEVKEGRQRSHSTPHIGTWLPLSLTEAAPRREALKEWQDKVADGKRGGRSGSGGSGGRRGA